ncbi:hypothetical protein [Frateuria sp. STR12]|uniref:hypothetical protein n=1 Tax=Frateuria hangzhouensis TaxID=2995589 RepID=UPI002260D765|nr:hypothetical protein [Frateuria sp. STR12]MCX7513878.1 hypothetical protein [Frateuria sp. STR12]
MTIHWLGKPVLAVAAILLASAAAWPTDAAARGHDRGWRGHGHGHYDRHDRGWHGHYRHDRGHWNGGRWVAGAIVAGAVIGLVDDALNPPPRTVVYERPVYRRPVRVIYEAPVVTRRVVETRTVYEDRYPPTRYVGYYGDGD